MKLKNKKTGEILELCCHRSGDYRERYDSLAELNEEWEDYEESKEDYIRVIESFIHYAEEADDSFYCDESVKKFIEKLKAWKRLKDKGFRFGGWETDSDGDLRSVFCNRKDRVQFNNIETLAMAKDLDLLFGGGE